jgi:hypothetical protein
MEASKGVSTSGPLLCSANHPLIQQDNQPLQLRRFKVNHLHHARQNFLQRRRMYLLHVLPDFFRSSESLTPFQIT